MAELTRAGVMVIEDFLVPAEFTAVEREAEEFMSLTEPTWIVRTGTLSIRSSRINSQRSRSGGPINELRNWRHRLNGGRILGTATEVHSWND